MPISGKPEISAKFLSFNFPSSLICARASSGDQRATSARHPSVIVNNKQITSDRGHRGRQGALLCPRPIGKAGRLARSIKKPGRFHSGTNRQFQFHE
jgi:hypothetical protein